MGHEVRASARAGAPWRQTPAPAALLNSLTKNDRALLLGEAMRLAVFQRIVGR